MWEEGVVKTGLQEDKGSDLCGAGRGLGRVHRWQWSAALCLGRGDRRSVGTCPLWLGTWGARRGGAGRGAPRADPALLSSLPQDRSLAGKLEPVSPPSPPHADPELELVPPRLSKEELIQNMDRVDREITMVEQQISKLRKKQVRALGEGGPREHRAQARERVLSPPTRRLVPLALRSPGESAVLRGALPSTELSAMAEMF